MPLELTDAEVLKLIDLLEDNVMRQHWPFKLQLLTKLNIYINSTNYNPTNEPPLIEPHFDENGHPVWPS